jgi:hypothetical protein
MKGDSPRKHRATTKHNKQEKNTHPPENYEKENNCTGPTMTTSTTCKLIQ